MSKSFRLMAPLAVLALLIAACGLPDSQGETTSTTEHVTTTTSNTGGEAFPVQLPDENYGHFPFALSGDLSLDDRGCWTIAFAGEERLLIFPMGFTLASDGSTTVSPTGEGFASGQSVDMTGGLTATSSLPGVPDGFWGNYLSFCDPNANEVVIVDDLSPAYDPTRLSDDELIELVESAELSESWPCGLGFTASTADQRVALYLNPNDFDNPASPPIEFPSGDWTGIVVVGKNLMVNHCDDVAEFWEPERVVAAEWPISAGSLRFEPPADLFCSAGGPIEAEFSAVAVDSTTGSIELGDLTLVNEAYGCFAG